MLGNPSRAATQGALSRRAVIRALGGGGVAVTGMALLNACGPAASPSSSSAPASPQTSAGQAAPPQAQAQTTTQATTQLSAPAAAAPTQSAAAVASAPVNSRAPQMPTYTPFNGPQADLPGAADGSVAAGYFKLPTNLIPSVSATPGKGSTVRMITWSVLPPPLAPDQNTWWQALNQQTGSNLAIDIVSFADYPTRFQVLMAGGDLPDVITTPYGVQVPHLPDFMRSACADLTPFVSGDAIKQYPNLANFATDSWRTVVFDNKIYGVPVPYPPIINVLWAHQELLEQIGSDPPKSGDDFKRILAALTKPDQQQWGISLGSQASGGMAGDMMNGFFPTMFRAPNKWRQNSDGTLTASTFETDEFKAALSFYRDLYASGVYHPDSPTFNSVSSRTNFQARKYAFMSGGIGSNNASQYMDKPPPMTPASKIRPVPPFAVDGGQPGVLARGSQPRVYGPQRRQATTASASCWACSISWPRRSAVRNTCCPTTA